MQTRKDLYQAHRLMTQRVGLALLQGRPGAVESPLRRTGVGALCGVMVVVLVAAGFGIAGLLFKGGARNLEKAGLVLIEKETGAVFAYSSQQRAMIPFLNYPSARLAMTETDIQQRHVSSRSLARYPRGPLTGIPGAPLSLPEARAKTDAWALCTSESGVSLVGSDVGGRPLTDAQALLVTGGERTWLIWRDRRLRISADAARALTAAAPRPVPERWLNGLPQGPDFAPPRIPGWGRSATGPDGRRAPIGQTFIVAAVAGTPERWYVQLADGLAAVSQTQARLLLERATGDRGPGAARTITPGAAAARPSAVRLHNGSLPETPPHPVASRPDERLCAVYRDVNKLSTEAGFTLGGTPPTLSAAVRSPDLDRIGLPGGGLFAGTIAHSGQRPQTFSVLTSQGVRYPVAGPEDATKLGYRPSSATRIPSSLVRLFSDGPILSSDAATRPVPATAP